MKQIFRSARVPKTNSLNAFLASNPCGNAIQKQKVNSLVSGFRNFSQSSLLKEREERNVESENPQVQNTEHNSENNSEHISEVNTEQSAEQNTKQSTTPKSRKNLEVKEEFDDLQSHSKTLSFNKAEDDSIAMHSPFSLENFEKNILPEGDIEKIKNWISTCLRAGKMRVLTQGFNLIDASVIEKLKEEIPSHIAKIYSIEGRYLDAVNLYESMDKSMLIGMDLVYIRTTYLESLVHLFKEEEALSHLHAFLKEHTNLKERIVLASSIIHALCKTGNAVKANSLRKELNFPLTVLARLSIIRGLIDVKEFELALINYVLIENRVLQCIKDQRFVFSNETLYDIRDKLCKGDSAVRKRVLKLPPLPPKDATGLNQSNVVYAHL